MNPDIRILMLRVSRAMESNHYWVYWEFQYVVTGVIGFDRQYTSKAELEKTISAGPRYQPPL